MRTRLVSGHHQSSRDDPLIDRSAHNLLELVGSRHLGNTVKVTSYGKGYRGDVIGEVLIASLDHWLRNFVMVSAARMARVTLSGVSWCVRVNPESTQSSQRPSMTVGLI